MINLQMFVFSTCLLLTSMLAKEVESGSCPKLENKIFDNLVDMMVAIKSGSQISGTSNEKDRPAFTATLKSHLTLSKDATIKYDTVILNQGKGYSPKTGIFTATKAGLYLISATVMSSGGTALGASISKNGANLMNLYGPKIHGGTETANPVLDLEKGDQVSVRSHGSYTTYGNNHSYFSAVYIA
ncbi:complement C1q-like protein 3 [Mytilus californianus]|uniref:complement C1q-like protein 3 n=1 Tax=Mytilus californianus TaxID=6549 RepID=UPI002247BBF0|nr:complement C1q-like protein 3 [Mytilus californianus]